MNGHMDRLQTEKMVAISSKSIGKVLLMRIGENLTKSS